MSASTLHKCTLGLRITIQIRPHPTVYLINIGLEEKRTVQVIDMLREQGSTHPALSYVKQ